MTNKQTIHTRYGEVEVKTIECDSCGNEVAKSDAYRFAMDDESPNKRMNDAERNGYACPICVDTGPISFPEKIIQSVELQWAAVPSFLVGMGAGFFMRGLHIFGNVDLLIVDFVFGSLLGVILAFIGGMLFMHLSEGEI